MRLQDVMKYQPKRDRPGSSSRGTSNRQFNSKSGGDKSPIAKKKKGSVIRPGASIKTASRRREETIELHSDTDEESSVEQVRYQNPRRKKSHSAINVDDNSGDESSKESDEEDEIPYKMNFSQPIREKSSDSSDSSEESDDDDDDDDIGYDSPVEHKQAPTEPLRPGDVIEYQNTTIFTAGLDIGHNTAKVLGTAPGAKFPLKLSSGDYLDATIRIRRTHECIKGKLYKHAGYWKPISFFKLRKRLLRNPDGTPVEPQGGVFGKAKAFNDLRENLHQKAVEYVRGDHDDRIGIGKDGMRKAGDASSKKPAAKSSKTMVRNREKDNKDDDSSTTSSSSSSSSEGSELRLEFERLSRERNKQLRKNDKNQHNKLSTSIRKSPPLLLAEDSDSDSDLDIPNSRKKISPQQQSRSSLVLKKVAARPCTSSTKKDDTRNNLRIVPLTKSKIDTEKRTAKDKSIEDSIDINAKSTKKWRSEKYKASDHLSISSSSLSSIGNEKARKSPVSKKRTSPPSTIFASKVDDSKCFKELLDDDSDSSGDDYLILSKAFAPPKKSISKLQTKRPPTTTKAKHDKKKSPPRKSYPSPMEENPVDLFEDSSSNDDDSFGGSECRKRNRRGERMLRSPSVDLLHRQEKRKTDDLLTQEECASERHNTLSTKPSSLFRKNVKRSVVVGYRPLSLSIDGRREEVQSSPPSLAKAYKKREARLQRERETQSTERNDSASEELGSPRRKKKKHETSKDTKVIDKGESNRRKLQREKRKLQKQRNRPPPYPPKRSDPLLSELSTQENEWSDMEHDTESNHRKKNEKKRNREHSKKITAVAETSSFSSPDSKPTPKKGSAISNHKRSSTKASQSVIDDSCDEEKQCGRKRLTPKSRLRKNISNSKPRHEQSRHQTKHKRYELSSSSSESAIEVQRRTPRTPWSTDCEVDSPLPSTIRILNNAAVRNSADSKGSKRSGKRKKLKKHHNRKPDVFQFPSQDENEDPTDKSFTKRRPNLANLSKRNSSKQKFIR